MSKKVYSAIDVKIHFEDGTVVNAKSFGGAKGDGITDDTEAIQRAIDAATYLDELAQNPISVALEVDETALDRLAEWFCIQRLARSIAYGWRTMRDWFWPSEN